MRECPSPKARTAWDPVESKVPVVATATISATSAPVCQVGARISDPRVSVLLGAATGDGLAIFLHRLEAGVVANLAVHVTQVDHRSSEKMNDAFAMGTPVLAAGWSLIYLLLGGGIGGAALLFFALKIIGK
jgi:hypothetical protein